MRGAVTVPFQITIFDAPFFVEYLANHFEMAANELEGAARTKGRSRKQAMRSDPDSSVVEFGKVSIVCHPHCTSFHEVRIAISLERSDFCLRIDRDRRGRVGFDVGSTSIESALKVAAVPITSENFPETSKLVGEDGSFRIDKEGRRLRRLANERFASVSEGERASLLFASFASCGFSLGTRQAVPVSHHNRERICDNWDEGSFADLVNSLGKALSQE
jgi:hypothetical protein